MKKIVIPYIICTAVYYLCYYRIDRIFEQDINGFLRFLVNGGLESHFYFVIVISQFYILMPIWYLFSKYIKMSVTITVGLILGVMWVILYTSKIDFYDRVFMTYLPYWMLGIAAGGKYEKFRKNAEKYFSVFFTLFLAAVVIDGPVFFCVTNLTVRIYVYEIIHMIYIFSAIMVLYGICCSSGKKPSLFSRAINGFSYEIYLWHCLILSYIDVYLKKTAITDHWQIIAIRFGIVTGIMIIVSQIVYFIKFLGKRRIRK